VNQIVNLSIGNGKEKETLCCGNGKVQMHVQVHYYKCLYHVMVFSTFLIFSPVQVLFKDGAFQWKRLENLSSCQGECVQDEQQPCTEKE